MTLNRLPFFVDAIQNFNRLKVKSGKYFSSSVSIYDNIHTLFPAIGSHLPVPVNYERPMVPTAMVP